MPTKHAGFTCVLLLSCTFCAVCGKYFQFKVASPVFFSLSQLWLFSHFCAPQHHNNACYIGSKEPWYWLKGCHSSAPFLHCPASVLQLMLLHKSSFICMSCTCHHIFVHKNRTIIHAILAQIKHLLAQSLASVILLSIQIESDDKPRFSVHCALYITHKHYFACQQIMKYYLRNRCIVVQHGILVDC